MFANIKIDFERYCKIDFGCKSPGSIKKIRLLFCTPGLHAIMVYRFGKWVVKHGNNPVYLLLHLIIKKLYGIQISSEANIGAGFYIGHSSDIEFGSCYIR